MTKLKLIIIGGTGTAFKRTIPALSRSEICCVTAVQGRNPEKLANIAHTFAIPKTYLNEAEMLEQEYFDAIFIGTPPFMHLDNIRLALSKGKPIICEKPLARSLPEARQIETLLASSPETPFMLAHQLRHQPSVQTIRTALKKGQIGQVLSVWAQWGFKLNTQASNAAWKLNPSLGGATAFHDAGIHLVDLMLYLFGRPKAVFASGFRQNLPQYDNLTANLIYEHMTIVLNASQTMKTPGNHLLIYGTEGRIEALKSIGEASMNAVIINDETLNFPPVNLYGNEVEDFLRSVLIDQSKFEGTDLKDAMTGMEILDAIESSLASASSVTL